MSTTSTRCQRCPETAVNYVLKPHTTKKRLQIAKAIVADAGGDTTAVEQASDICAPHVDGWNMAAHGNPETTPVTEAEIDAARDACVTLAAGAA